MQEKELRTTTKQRVIIITIAVLTLASTVLAYLLIVLAGNKSNNTAETSPELAALQEEYSQYQSETNEYAATLSQQYLEEFKGYKSRVKAYNATTANSDGLKTVDLKEGTGRELTEGDTDYFAYYIGWCADEAIFDSSFNDSNDPTALNTPLAAGIGLIEGWNQGVIGMKIGGVREISIPAELAYGDTQEICGTTNSPLKFIVMPIADDKLSELSKKMEKTYNEMVEKISSN
ncbi:FKBP-type peptidyl-prolyl cis-trans isomerase [Candidatus Saccharibacteria bacterium]|nr:FKBP-type peptidyl-prolyl cis-trans isomerase [Candidatus Saccharibacteria bacterium]